jgi:hypothetical protein
MLPQFSQIFPSVSNGESSTGGNAALVCGMLMPSPFWLWLDKIKKPVQGFPDVTELSSYLPDPFFIGRFPDRPGKDARPAESQDGKMPRPHVHGRFLADGRVEPLL